MKSMFNTSVKSQRRSKIISIRTPKEFRNSIRELKKDKYTIGDQRALQLAKNRASTILNKTNLSLKEKKQFKQISKINIPKAKR